MNKAEKSLRWVVNQIPDFTPKNNEEKMLVAIKLYSEAGAEEIKRLEAENAALSARLEKAEMALILSCSEIALLGICCQGCENEENCRISFLDGGYQLKTKTCEKYWITKAEARLAEMKGGQDG